jgi:hypothetical protein
MSSVQIKNIFYGGESEKKKLGEKIRIWKFQSFSLTLILLSIIYYPHFQITKSGGHSHADNH